MEVDSMHKAFELEDHVRPAKPNKKRRADVNTLDYEVVCTTRSFSALKLDPHSASTSDDEEAHVLHLPDSMVTPRLITLDTQPPYPYLGELSAEIHCRICHYLPQNDVWNLSRCNRHMSATFPQSITVFRTRGTTKLKIAHQLAALHRTPYLESLTVSSFHPSQQNWTQSLVSNCPHLKHLRLIDCHIPVLSYAAIGFLKSLKSLEIENAQVDDFHCLFDHKILEALQPANSPSSSTSSSPSDHTLSTDSSSSASTSSGTSHSSDLSSRDASAPLRLFGALERLTIVPSRSYVLAIIVSHMPNLKKLKATLEPEEKPSKYLAMACSSLRSLTLNTTYCDKSMPIEFVRTFRILSHLKTLDLNTGVDDNNIRALCRKLTNLTTLRIRNAHNLGKEGLEQIRTLPHLKCLFIDFGFSSMVPKPKPETFCSWIVEFKSMSTLTNLTILLPHCFALEFVHDTLIKELRRLQRLQLANLVYHRT